MTSIPVRPHTYEVAGRTRGSGPVLAIAGRVASGMPAAWLAACTTRPEVLAVDESLFYPARLSDDGDTLTPARDIDHPDVVDDAVDELIELVLVRGGWIAFTDPGALDHHHGVALASRR